MKKSATLLLISASSKAYSCTTCNRELQDGIYNSTFFPNLGIMLSAFIVIAILVLILSKITRARHKKYVHLNPHSTHLDPVPLATTSMILGIGLGGFLDGIVLHQILQWHEMLSNKVPVDTVLGKSINMFWDGVFHLFCFIITVIGTVLLYKLLFRTDVNRSRNLLKGGLLAGWGIFNVIEGVINHQILQLHFVKQQSPNPQLWNLVFLGISVVLIIIGVTLVCSQRNYKLTSKPDMPSIH
jgi:uncharacterized membrane protein